MINKHSIFLSYGTSTPPILHLGCSRNLATQNFECFFCFMHFTKVQPYVFAWSGRRVLAWPGTGSSVGNTSESQSFHFLHYFTTESDEWFCSFSLSEPLVEQRAFERRAKREIQKMNAWASAIHGKKLSGERIANLEKMSECPALRTAISATVSVKKS